MKIANSFADLVGNTPLMELHGFETATNTSAHIFGKLEYLNPAGSAKDRIAVAILNAAEKDGTLKAGGTIIEPTSGNTGVGLAAVGAARGYKVLIIMPETMSRERQLLMKAYGAELILTEGKKGMQGALDKAAEIQKATPGSILAGQFVNPENPKAHYETTGPEIYTALDGKVDIFIAGVGTGGTVSGAGKYLKEQNPNVKVYAVEPSASPLLSEGKAGPHAIQGIGANFVPDTLDKTVYDAIVTVSNEDALHYSRLVSHKDGIFVGISSGAALAAAVEIANRPENAGKNIVAFLPDGGDRYLSTALLEDDPAL